MLFKTLKLIRINQFVNETALTSKGVYSGVWRFADIKNCIEFTYRVANNYFNELDLLPPKKPRNENDYFQRLVSDDRTYGIIEFLLDELKNNTSFIAFPTSFILSAPLTELDPHEFMGKINLVLDSDEFINDSLGVLLDNGNIIVPQTEFILVVDGQHRLAGLEILHTAIKELISQENEIGNSRFRKVIEKTKRKIIQMQLYNLDECLNKIEEFQLLITILIDFDIYEQGKVFADVNFNQKPVNRSLYYDIYGAYPDIKKNEIYLLHKWCVRLNSDPDSQLRNKFKLLGTGNGYISQAFFCDALLPFLRKNGIWYKMATDFSLDKTAESDKIFIFLKSYFNAIALIYNSDRNSNIYFWPNEKENNTKFDSILLKTTGLGALIKLIPNFYNLVKDILSDDVKLLTAEIKKEFENRLNKEKLSSRMLDNPDAVEIINAKVSGEYYFSKSKGRFAGGAGKGLQSKLYEELKNDLNFNNNVTQVKLL